MPDVVGKLLGEAGEPGGPGGPDVVGRLLSGEETPAPVPRETEGPGFVESAASLVTGEGRTEFPEAPELGTSGPDVPPFSGQGLRMAGAYATSVEPEQIADIAVDTLPGATRHADKFGNVMIAWKGKDYYVNKPGVSEADMFQLAAMVAAYAPAAKLGAVGKSLLVRMGIVGGGSGATSVGMDVASGALGSEQGVSGTRAAIATAAGGAFEALSPLAVKAWRFVFGNPKLFDPATQTLTKRGEEAARASGLDPAQMDDVVRRMFAEEAEEAVTGAAARTSGKEFDIPMTRGQATGEYGQLGREEATRHGAYGEKAGAIVREFDEAQQAAMREARGGIQARVGGGEARIATPQEAGETVAAGLARREEASGQLVREAYDEAAEYSAKLTPEGIKGLTRRLGQAVKDFAPDAELHPATVRTLKRIGRLERQVPKRVKSGAPNFKVELKRIENERKIIGNAIGSAKNPSDRAALTRIKREYDTWLDDVFDNALFEGDDAALAALKSARAKRYEHGQLYEPRGPKDEAGKVIQKILVGDRSPEQVMNYVFGRGRLGDKDVSVQLLGRLKAVFGDDSAEWLTLREAGWLKLSKEISVQTFSPTKYRNNLNRVMETNRTLMEELFPADQLAMFGRFRDEVMRTVTPEAMRNPSKTAYTLARLTREWTGRIGQMMMFSGNPLAGGVMFTSKRIPNILGARGARKATRPLLRPKPRAPGFVATGTAGTVYGTED